MKHGSEAWHDERPYQVRHPSGMDCTLEQPGRDVRSESAIWLGLRRIETLACCQEVAMRPLHRVSYGSAQLPKATPKCLLPVADSVNSPVPCALPSGTLGHRMFCVNRKFSLHPRWYVHTRLRWSRRSQGSRTDTAGTAFEICCRWK